MKIISSTRKLTALVGVAIVIAATATSPAFAHDVPDNTTPHEHTPESSVVKETRESLSTTKKAEACSRFASLGDSSRSALANRSSELQSDFSKRLDSIASRQTAVDQKVSTTRSNGSATFDARVEKLKATDGITDDQLQLVDVFVTNMKQAAATRNAAVDAARTAYRTGLATEVAAHQQALSAAVATYQAAVAAAVATAKTNCGDGTAGATLKTTVKTAREALQATRKSAKITATIKTLAETRQAAVKAANEAFKATAAAHAKTLSSALKPTTTE